MIGSEKPPEIVPWHYQPPWDPYAYRASQRTKHRQDLQRWLKRFGALCAVSLFAYLALAVVIIMLMTPEIADNLFGRADALFIITPAVTPILEISGAILVLYYLFLAGTIVVAYLFLIGKSHKRILREILQARPEKHSPILVVGGLFFAVLAIQYLYYSIIEAGGAVPNVPSIGGEPYWYQIYIFAQASVWEEIISRILLIGVPLLWIDLLFRRDKLQQPKNYFFGGTFELGAVEVGLIVFSAAMFGLAHAGGWDFWKVPPTIIAGLAFGYLFARLGLYAAIMFHFAFDFLTIPVINAGPAPRAILGLIIMIWLVAGIMFTAYYLLQLKRFLFPKMNRSEEIVRQIGP